jgi:hypothetical protein
MSRASRAAVRIALGIFRADLESDALLLEGYAVVTSHRAKKSRAAVAIVHPCPAPLLASGKGCPSNRRSTVALPRATTIGNRLSRVWGRARDSSAQHDYCRRCFTRFRPPLCNATRYKNAVGYSSTDAILDNNSRVMRFGYVTC